MTVLSGEKDTLNAPVEANFKNSSPNPLNADVLTAGRGAQSTLQCSAEDERRPAEIRRAAASRTLSYLAESAVLV